MRALERRGLEYDVNPGDGAFYGPKIDLHMTDSIGRSWQLGTVQLDYSMPERFGITYTGEDNAEHRPVMIHRALFGSFERFIGILTEHFRGEFPVWLAPVQAIVLPIADRHHDYAGCVRNQLSAAGVRVELDDRTESVGRKIRDAELRKVPFMLVVGDREQEAGEVGVREHRAGDAGLGRRWMTFIDARRRSSIATREVHLSRSRLYLLSLIQQHSFHPARRRLTHRRKQQLVPVPRRFDRRPPERDQTRINDRIRVPEVRLVGEDGKQIGVMKTSEALAYAQERDLDLVEVAPDARPPVCRVLDYSKYKYEQAQKQKAARKHQQQITIREIKFRPKIAQNDYDTKKGHVARFLLGQGQGQGHDHVPRPRGDAPRARRRAAGQAGRGARRRSPSSSRRRCRTAAT